MFTSSSTRWPRRHVRGPGLRRRICQVATGCHDTSALQGQLDEFSRKAV